jgi:predicted permease
MSLRRFFARLRSWRKRDDVESELTEEIRAHLQIEEDEQRAAGVSAAEARDAARRAFGNVTLAKEASRDAWIFRWAEELFQDLRYALRQMRRNPGFTAVAILTLALGIGANTAIFSLVNNIMLRKLPVQNPDQLLLLKWTSKPKGFYPWHGYADYGGCDSTDPGSGDSNCSFSYPVFENFRKHAKSFENIAAYGGGARAHLDWNGKIVSAYAEVVSGEFFSTLDVNPLLGRVLAPEDDQPGAQPVVVLQFNYWLKQFGGDPNVVGKTIGLNGAAFTIIGVTPPEFFGLQPGQRPMFWMPIHSRPRLGEMYSLDFDVHTARLYVFARTKPNVKLEKGRSELVTIFRSTLADAATTSSASERKTPDAAPRGTPDDMNIGVTSLAHGLAGLSEYSVQLSVLMAVTGLVLLIACTNIANLLLSRGSARRHEIAVRVSVGAGRMRLVRQLMTESLLLALAGGGAGLLISFWASRVLGSLILSRTAEILQPHLMPDPLVLGFAFGTAALSATAFGLGPAFATTRVAPGVALKSSIGAIHGKRRIGRTLVAVEMAIALVLLIGAGLFVRTLISIESINPGFRVDHLLNFAIAPDLTDISDDKRSALVSNLRDRLARIPGVESVAWANAVFLAGGISTTTVQLEGRDDLPSVPVDVARVGPHFFQTMGIPVLAGRDVEERDCIERASTVDPAMHDRAVWINRLMAERYFRNSSPLGTYLKGGAEIVGVVGNFKYQSLRSDLAPTVFRPGLGSAYVNFELRSFQDPAALAAQIRAAVAEVMPNMVIEDMKTQQELVDGTLTSQRTMAQLSSSFGVLAVIMAAVGVHGVLAYSVTRRTREIAVRMSLGAMPRDILRLVVREGLAPAISGAGIGLLLAYGLTRLIESSLWGVKPVDALTFGVATFALLAIAALACYFPARRAMRVDPMTALRYE